jgi:TRAP-type C4-dicarboxylate transport system permease large subunit
MFMDATAAIFILVPIMLPAVQAVGVSPLFFTVFLVITLSFGLITPPVGVCLYAAENVTGLPLEKIIKASIPWILLIAVTICVFILFPQLIEVPVTLVFGS